MLGAVVSFHDSLFLAVAIINLQPLGSHSFDLKNTLKNYKFKSDTESAALQTR
jgi:hypothetical protein